jgi:hypothetical protein
MAVRAPARYGIGAMPQPLSAAQMLAGALRTDLSGARRFWGSSSMAAAG